MDGWEIAVALLSFNTALQIWIVQTIFKLQGEIVKIKEELRITNNRLDRLDSMWD